MNLKDIEERVIRVVTKTLSGLESTPEKVTPESAFVEDLGADSLDLNELIMNLEEEFDIVITDEDAENITTVQGAINYIASVLKVTK